MIIPVIDPCRQNLFKELFVIMPVVVPCRQHLCVELFVIIPVIVFVDSVYV